MGDQMRSNAIPFRLKENFAERLSSMKAEHLKALDHLRVTHALEHSSSKVAELKNKVDTQEVQAP